jgi:hypothetical protein
VKRCIRLVTPIFGPVVKNSHFGENECKQQWINHLSAQPPVSFRPYFFVTRSTGNRELGKQRSGGARELLPLCFTVTDTGPYSLSVF